jgi:hypothetical protein
MPLPAGMPSGGGGGGGGGGGDQQLRHARRLFIGGLDDGTTEADVRALFTDIARLSMLRPLPAEVSPVLSVFCSEKKFAFVELYSLELAAALLALNGMSVKGGAPLRVCRPSDYKPEAVPLEARGRAEPCDFSLAAARLSLTLPPPGAAAEVAGGGGGGGGGGFGGGGAAAAPPAAGGAPAVPPDLLADPTAAIGRRGDPASAHRMFLGNLPPDLGELKLLQLMQVFGVVKALVIHKGPDGSLKPFGHAEYVDPSVTDVAIQALNQLEVGGRKIKVERANSGGAGGARGGGGGGGLLAGPAAAGSALAMAALGLGYGGAAAALAQPGVMAAALGLGGLGYGAAPPAGALPPMFAPPPPPPMQQQQGGRVVVLENMVTPADLASEAAYRELSDDVKTECAWPPRARARAAQRSSALRGAASLSFLAPCTHTHTHTRTFC